MPFTLRQIENRLSDYRHTPGWELLRPRRAAVALVVREGARGCEVLLMRRSRRQGDPWSGDVALPGGRHEPVDPDLVHTARRETLEEIGLDLGRARPAGKLEDQLATPSLTRAPLVVTPVVFTLPEPEHPPFVLSAEAARAFWTPLAPLVQNTHAGTHEWKMAGLKLRMPCWHYDGEVIWGLTYRILETFFAAVR